VERAFKIKREDPEKFARSPRLQWIVETFWKIVDDSERERTKQRELRRQERLQ